MTATRAAFSISDDKNLLNIAYIHHFLSTRSHWARNIPIEVVRRSVEGSLCFGIFHHHLQVGFARMITDSATFAYLADVFVDEAYRRQGLSKWLMEVMLAHPALQGLRRIMLSTRDAHTLYARFGFMPPAQPERIMQLNFPDRYENMPQPN